MYINCGTATTTRVNQTGVVYESDLVYDLANKYKKLSPESKMKFLDIILKIDI